MLIGLMILFLPPYSPDLNLIEESFSTCGYSNSLPVHMLIIFHREEIHGAEDPIATLKELTACITAEMAEGWFRHAGYIW
jgi:hypothetical protein